MRASTNMTAPESETTPQIMKPIPNVNVSADCPLEQRIGEINDTTVFTKR